MAQLPDVPCRYCGTLTYTTKGSAPASERVCQPCRRSNPEHLARMAERRAAREHSKYAVQKAALIRACAWCRDEFEPSGPEVMCCSWSCAQYRRNAEGRGRRGFKSDEERRTARLERWQGKNRRRRALKRGAKSEPYTLEEIAARDEFRCGICSDPVGMDLRRPDRGSPTIDHVQPIVLGGDDTKANVQLAHFGCNSRKGARAA